MSPSLMYRGSIFCRSYSLPYSSSINTKHLVSFLKQNSNEVVVITGMSLLGCKACNGIEGGNSLANLSC